MTDWDIKYLELCKRILCKRILKEGIEVENRTGINTIKVPSHNFHFDLSKEFPILQTKQLFFKNAITEMLWIYQAQSNDVSWLHERNNHIWDKWVVDKDGYYRDYDDNTKELKSEKFYGEEFAGTIGTAYGWIVNRYKLIDKLINTIKNNPKDRRLVMSLWQDEWLNTAVLPSCVWSSEWDITDGKLNMLVHQRSCDVALGLPFNVTQYATLLSLIAKTTDLEAGSIDWSIKDAHFYVDQIDGIKEQLKREEVYNKLNNLSIKELKLLKENLETEQFEKEITKESDRTLKIIDIIINPEKPYLWVNPDIKDFYSYDNSSKLNDIKVKQYKHMGKIDFPKAH